MGQVHRFLGLSVGLIQQDMRPEERRRNYNCDITYATNSELGFDYLRDNMAADISEVVQREFQYCVIDEVDSILIDEARTPLIISGQVTASGEVSPGGSSCNSLARAAIWRMVSILRETMRWMRSNVAARSPMKVSPGLNNCLLSRTFDPQDPWAHYITNALKAKELLEGGTTSFAMAKQSSSMSSPAG